MLLNALRRTGQPPTMKSHRAEDERPGARPKLAVKDSDLVRGSESRGDAYDGRAGAERRTSKPTGSRREGPNDPGHRGAVTGSPSQRCPRSSNEHLLSNFCGPHAF